MSKVITFSRVFPSYHPKAGKPTYFVEKIQKALDQNKSDGQKNIVPPPLLPFFNFAVFNECSPKYHTIRSGNRWKVGDKFSPRVWSGKPYNSKQIIIAPDIEIKQVWDFEIDNYRFLINGELFYHQHQSIWHHAMESLAQNDGLSFGDLLSWFKVPTVFKGQIICWSDSIKY